MPKLLACLFRIHEALLGGALRRDRRGVTALEYGLIAALIAVAIVTSVTSVGTKLSSTFTYLASKV